MANIIAIADRDNTIQAHVEVFASGTPDIDWLRDLGERRPRPIVVCGDVAILRNNLERAALRSSGLTFVVFAKGWTQMPWPDYVWKFLKVWPAIVAECRALRHASIVEVAIGGKVQRVRDTSAL